MLVWQGLSREILHPGQWLEPPAPVQSEYTVEVFATPPPPSDARLSPPLPSRQKGADFHLHILVHLTEGTTRATNPEVLYPAGKRGIDPRHHLREREGPTLPDDVAHFRLDCFAGLLLRSQLEIVSVPLTFSDTAQVKSQKPKGFPLQCVHHLRFLLVQFHAQGRELFLEPLLGSFRPASFGVVATNGDDESSSPGESHPQALTDPDLNVSAHPALIVQSPHDATSANEQTTVGLVKLSC